MGTKTIEINELIATRIKGAGDSWILVADSKNITHKTLTDTLETYLSATEFRGEYRLDPMGSKLYAIKTNEEEIKPPPVKKFNIYGDEE